MNESNGTDKLNPLLRALVDRMVGPGTPPLSSLTVADMRQNCREFGAMAGASTAVKEVRDIQIPGPAQLIPLRIYNPGGNALLPVVIFFHGGGWIMGDLGSYDVICRTLASRAHAIVVSVDYRLAPENQYPGAVEDAFAATQWVFEHAQEFGGDSDRIAVAGDSAGGTLAAVVAIMARDAGIALCRQILIYPAVDLTMSYPSHQEFADGYFLNNEQMELFVNHYLPESADRKNWQVSPIFAPNLKNLAPALVITAEFDPLRDEGEAYAKRLKESDVEATVIRYPGMIHAFWSMAARVPAGQEAMEQVAESLTKAFDLQAVVY